MLRVIKVEAKSSSIYFSEMLWVNLHLLWLLLNKLFPLAVFLQKAYMPGTAQKTHKR